MADRTQAAYSQLIPYGPVNRDALALLDSKRLAMLPSSSGDLRNGAF